MTIEGTLEKPLTVAKLLQNVDARIKGSAEEVTRRVEDALVEQELKSRETALTLVVSKYSEAKKSFDRLGPDQVRIVEVDGKPNEEKFYSKAQYEARRKAKEELERLEQAIAKAMTGDFGKVKELAAKGGGQKDGAHGKDTAKDSSKEE